MYDFISIDFEIANDDMNSACSMGLVCVKDLEIINKEYFLIKPPTDVFLPENTAIHHLNLEDVKDAEKFDSIWQRISHYFDGSYYIVSHNAQFDMSVLSECLDIYNIEKPDFQYLNSISFSTKVCHGCGQSLEDRCTFLGIEIENHHNALADAEKCAQIIIKSVEKSRFRTIHTYLKGYSSIPKRNFSDLKPQKKFKKYNNFQKFRSMNTSDLTPQNTNFNPENPFFEKTCVLTGELKSLSRREAAQKILDAGGSVKSKVSGKTDFLIIGIQDTKIVGKDGISSKERSAISFNKSGCSIKIIHEDEFLKMLS